MPGQGFNRGLFFDDGALNARALRRVAQEAERRARSYPFAQFVDCGAGLALAPVPAAVATGNVTAFGRNFTTIGNLTTTSGNLLFSGGALFTGFPSSPASLATNGLTVAAAGTYLFGGYARLQISSFANLSSPFVGLDQLRLSLAPTFPATFAWDSNSVTLGEPFFLELLNTISQHPSGGTNFQTMDLPLTSVQGVGITLHVPPVPIILAAGGTINMQVNFNLSTFVSGAGLPISVFGAMMWGMLL